MKLPDKPTPKVTSFERLSVLLYGQPKIGKSTFCSQLPNAIFLATEAGLHHVDCYQVPCPDWAALTTACGELAKGQHQFRTIVIDTIDNAYRMCREHMCRENGLDHESDAKFGKGYALINNEFGRVLTRLSLLPYGLWMTSHAQSIEIDTTSGKRTRVIPTLPAKAREVISAMADQILYAEIDLRAAKQTRVLRAKPNQAYEAGDRTGKLDDTMELSAAEYLRQMGNGGGAP